MKRECDTITIESRAELHDLLDDLDKIPEAERSQATKDLIRTLSFMDSEW